jgi:hypothetical protein
MILQSHLKALRVCPLPNNGGFDQLNQPGSTLGSHMTLNPNVEVKKMCVQLYNNLYPFSPIPSCVAIPNHPSNRPLPEYQESGQSDRGTSKCARQSDPGLLGRARAPVRLNQNRNNWTARAGAGRTELASQSEAARTTRLFATEQSGINGARLYRRIGGIPEEYRETYRNRGTFYRRRIFYSMY